MSKKLSLILCIFAFFELSNTLETANIIRNLEITVSNASTVPFHGHLYTVSKTKSHIHINSSDSNYHPCDITINEARDVTQGRLEITSTEDEIFIVGVKSITGDEKYKYTILRVDPITCSYKSADIPETNDKRGDYFFPRLVKQRTGTDVFYPSLQNCAPCRLNNAGLRVQRSTTQLPREIDPPGVPFQIQFVNSLNSYFYVYNSNNFSASVESTTIKLLDADDLSTRKEKIIDFPVYAASKQKKSNGYLGVCTKTYDEFMADISAYTEVRCDKINSNLETINTIRIPMEPYSQPISSISYEFDKEGNSYVSFAEDTKLRLYIHDKNGKLVKALDMGNVDKKFEYYPDSNPLYFDAYDYWDTRGFLVGADYCIVTEQVSTRYSTPLHQVRCVQVKKNLERKTCE